MTENEEIEQLKLQVEKLKAKAKKNKELRPDRGIETMFRTTSRNHLQLSAIADNKANILISINSIILSILFTVMFRKLEEYPYLVIATVLLTVFCLITIVIAILATRPHVNQGIFSKEDVIQKKNNLLFFGNFHQMPVEDYEWAMREVMADANYLYDSLIRDIYYLGVVLGKKYRYLRIAYTVFMIGIVLSGFAFILSELYLKPLYPY
ncbi:hypothetical protein KFE98_18005 [bacterium SCSIO 12741]|nr:hypothetical protein KFE98_18005 [bacterium SCSIO 12741]